MADDPTAYKSIEEIVLADAGFNNDDLQFAYLVEKLRNSSDIVKRIDVLKEKRQFGDHLLGYQFILQQEHDEQAAGALLTKTGFTSVVSETQLIPTFVVSYLTSRPYHVKLATDEQLSVNHSD